MGTIPTVKKESMDADLLPSEGYKYNVNRREH
jgi:hypothetical protein